MVGHDKMVVNCRSEGMDMEKNPFKEYLKESEPDKAYKGYAWSTAIGLQAVDGLKLSKYLNKKRVGAGWSNRSIWQCFGTESDAGI